MFAKLLKHEWKANSKLLGILSAVAALLGVIACVIAGVIIPTFVNLTFVDEATTVLTTLALIFFWIFLIVSIGVYSVAVTFILAYRFYKNKYTDEGYLTFTLPVTSNQIFFSSFVNMTIWSAIAAVITFASIYGSLTLLLSSIYDLDQMYDVTIDMIDFFTYAEGIFAIVYVLLSLVSYLFAFITSIVTIHASITIGAVIVKRFKMLAAIGIYYAINFGMSLISTFASYTPIIISAFSASDTVYAIAQIAVVLIQIVIYAALIVIGYRVSVSLMDKKLNLP